MKSVEHFSVLHPISAFISTEYMGSSNVKDTRRSEAMVYTAEMIKSQTTVQNKIRCYSTAVYSRVIGHDCGSESVHVSAYRVGWKQVIIRFDSHIGDIAQYRNISRDRRISIKGRIVAEDILRRRQDRGEALECKLRRHEREQHGGTLCTKILRAVLYYGTAPSLLQKAKHNFSFANLCRRSQISEILG